MVNFQSAHAAYPTNWDVISIETSTATLEMDSATVNGATGADSITVYYATARSGVTKWETKTASSLVGTATKISFPLTNLTPGSWETLSVRSIDSTGAIIMDSPTVVSFLTKPGNPIISNVRRSDSITVLVDIDTSTVGSYFESITVRAVSTSGGATRTTSLTESGTATLTNLDAGETYTVKAYAGNGSGNSAEITSGTTIVMPKITPSSPYLVAESGTAVTVPIIFTAVGTNFVPVYAIKSGGALPTGLTLETMTGTIHGTPIEIVTNKPYVIEAGNGIDSVTSSAISLTVYSASYQKTVESTTATSYTLILRNVTETISAKVAIPISLKTGEDVTFTLSMGSNTKTGGYGTFAISASGSVSGPITTFDNPLILTIPYTASASVAYSTSGETWTAIAETTTADAITTASMGTLREVYRRVNFLGDYSASGDYVQIHTLHLTQFGNRKSGTISISSGSASITAGSTTTLSATASDAGTVTYSVVSGPCSVSSTTLSGSSAGICYVRGVKASYNEWTDATSESITVSVAAAPASSEPALSTQPALVITSPGTVEIGKAVSLTTTGGATGKSVSFSGGTTGICTVSSSGTVTPAGAGTCAVTATSTASGYAATTASLNITVVDPVAVAAAKAKAEAEAAAFQKALQDAVAKAKADAEAIAAAEAAKVKAAADAKAALEEALAKAAVIAAGNTLKLGAASSKGRVLTLDLADQYEFEIATIQLVKKVGKKTTYVLLDYVMLEDKGVAKVRLTTKIAKGQQLRVLIGKKVVKTITA